MTSPLDRTNIGPTPDDAEDFPASSSETGDYRTIKAGKLTIHFELDALDGIARDVVEGFKALPRRGIEVGGLLLGRKEAFGDDQALEIWIERFQRIPCEHKFGPQYILDALDQARLEEAALRITQSGELAVLGTYRSHTRAGFQLEDSDLEFADRYFGDPSDLVLLVKPESLSDLKAQFFARDASLRMEQTGEMFPFHGRILGLFHSFEDGPHPVLDPEIAEAAPSVPEPNDGQQNDSNPLDAFRLHRLVPDFVPAGDSPNPRPVFRREMFRTLEIMRDPHEEPEDPGFVRRWWPLLGAIVLVIGAAAVLLWPAGRVWNRQEKDAAATPIQAEAFRPLGLYVDPAGQHWRITWNQTATPLSAARSVGLFVREGDDQTRIDLSPDDLKSGTYEFNPKGSDVTFRLEVTDAAGRVSAESFRVMRTARSEAALPNLSPVARPVAKAPAPRLVAPKATRRVPPVVPASIRPRIRGAVGIDVKVRVDTKGRVTAATPVKRYSGINAYLADRAVAAAKQWRFAPATQDGRAVAGSQSIHFVFDR